MEQTEYSENSIPTQQMEQITEIWAVGGGKGGVGKSLVTANISISLAMLGYKVICIDLDLGGANLHTCLGVPIPKTTLSDFISKKVRSIEDLLTQTSLSNLFLISGAQDSLGIANLTHLKKNYLLSCLSELRADYIIIDLGAGTSKNTLDFFISADKGILTGLPEPTSVENTYRFIRSAYFRKLQSIECLLDISPQIDKALNDKISPSRYPAESIKKILEQKKGLKESFEEELKDFCFHLIVNQVRTDHDAQTGLAMKSVCKKFFDLNLNYLGPLEYDASVWQSVKKKKPLILEYPHSALVQNFDSILKELI